MVHYNNTNYTDQKEKWLLTFYYYKFITIFTIEKNYYYVFIIYV